MAIKWPRNPPEVSGTLLANLYSFIRNSRTALREIVLYGCAYLFYLLTRGLVHSDTRAEGLVNGEKVASFQSDLGFLWEPGWQSWALENIKALVVAMNWVYIATYWPVILLAALVLFVKNRRAYNFYRTIVLVNLAVAVATFMVFPVASPFAIPGVELSDSIQEFGPRFYGSESMSSFYNISAAMPSLHFSWTVILGVLFWRSFPGWYRMIGLLYPITTFFAITLTGNHFILDAIAGGLLAGMSFGMVLLLRAFQPRLFNV